MASVRDIPPEILAAAFEMAIFTWGISVLQPLAQVCPSWRDIIHHTPRLWGIILLERKVVPKTAPRFIAQLEKAKEAPLSIVCSPAARDHDILKKIAALSHNWVMADMNTGFMSMTRWSRLEHSLQELKLSRYGLEDWTSLSDAFFDDGDDVRVRRPSKLRSFTAISLPQPWVVGFLSRNPTIQKFRLKRGHNSGFGLSPSSIKGFFDSEREDVQRIQDTWRYLSLVPHATSIELFEVIHISESSNPPPATHFHNLRTLRLIDVLYPSVVLSNMATPKLQTLAIDGKEPQFKGKRFVGIAQNEDKQLLAPFFAQWSQPSFLPEHLHTLELKACIEVGDVPYLIRWLERLDHLIRLIVVDDSIGEAARSPVDDGSSAVGETNLFRALAQPRSQKDGTMRWICPSLMILHLQADQELSDLISIARVRGGRSLMQAPAVANSSTDASSAYPGRLRRIESMVCFGRPNEAKELESLVDELYCVCTHCGLMSDAGIVDGLDGLDLAAL